MMMIRLDELSMVDGQQQSANTLLTALKGLAKLSTGEIKKAFELFDQVKH